MIGHSAPRDALSQVRSKACQCVGVHDRLHGAPPSSSSWQACLCACPGAVVVPAAAAADQVVEASTAATADTAPLLLLRGVRGLAWRATGGRVPIPVTNRPCWPRKFYRVR